MKYSNNSVSASRNSQGLDSGKKICQYHGICGHTTNESMLLKFLVQKEKLIKFKANKKRKYTKHEVNVLVERKVKKAMKKKKKKCKEELGEFENMSVSDSDEE